MDCDEKNEPMDKEESEEDSSKDDLEEFSEKSLETRATSSESERNEETENYNRASPINSSASELIGVSFSREAEGACNIPDTGPYQSLIQRGRERNKMEEDENKDQHSSIPDYLSSSSSLHSNFAASGSFETSSKTTEDAFGKPHPKPTTFTQHHELSLMEKKDSQVKDKSIKSSSTESSQSEVEASGMSENDAMETEGACGISEPSSIRQASLIEQYQGFNLMGNRHDGRVQDRALEGSSRSNAAFSTASVTVYHGAIRIPGTFASFIQQHRDFDLTEDSDYEDLDDRPIWTLQPRQREPSASNRGSGSLGESSEEFASRSTSEASHSSGIPEIKEASASESLPLKQFHREINPSNDEATDDEGAIDEDEVDPEPEEYQDSDSERKGYSL